MTNQQIFLGAIDSRVRRGILEIPREVSAFYDCIEQYVLTQSSERGYRYLAIYPVSAIESTSNTITLERVIINDEVEGLKISQSSLLYLILNFGGRSKYTPKIKTFVLHMRDLSNIFGEIAVKIIGMRDHFEVWLAEDYERYEHSIDLSKIKALLAEHGL